MKRIYIAFVAIGLILSCSSDDNEASIDMDLLSGQWFRTNSCPDQNNMVFNADGTYVYTYSGNPCGNNDNDTVQTSGTFTLNGISITFNQQTSEIIEEGDIVSIPIEDFNTLIAQRIIVLTETELVIEREFSIEPFFQNLGFFRE
ncbi:MAG: lipocalin family protein [Bacteroidota bacterium]